MSYYSKKKIVTNIDKEKEEENDTHISKKKNEENIIDTVTHKRTQNDGLE